MANICNRLKSLQEPFDGIDIGEYNANRMLHTKVYEMMFPDGAMEQYASNIIVENLMNQVDDDGHHFQLLEEIIDNRTDGTEIKDYKGCLPTYGHQLEVW